MNEANIIEKIGDTVIHKKTITSGIPSQHGKGGQSQQRFLRKHQEAVKSFVKRVYNETKDMAVVYIGNPLLVDMIREF